MEAVLQVTYSGSFTPGRFFFSAFLHYIPQLPGLDWLESADFESGGRERGGGCSVFMHRATSKVILFLF